MRQNHSVKPQVKHNKLTSNSLQEKTNEVNKSLGSYPPHLQKNSTNEIVCTIDLVV